MIQTLHLFPILHQKLIELLRSLTPEDWNKRTIAKQWTVKDITAHLLDGNLRVMSMMRDQYLVPPDREINSYSDLDIAWKLFTKGLRAEEAKVEIRGDEALAKVALGLVAVMA